MKVITEICERALDFLQRQRLTPLPSNYHIAFSYCDGINTGLVTAIESLTDGGVRLTQAQADELYAEFYGRSAATYDPKFTVSSDMIRHQTLRLADLAASATAATGDLNRELAGHLPNIASADTGDLMRLVATMLEQSRVTEDKLAATTTELETLREKLEVVQGDAERDALTGLPNRRGIDAHLAAACGSEEPVVVAICDVDRFKSYNDRYGHAVGDRVLKTVAATLSSALEGHFVGRWGGEEFIVVARGALADGIALINSAKDELGDRHFKLRETDEPMGRITFSAGVTPLPATMDEVAAAIERADALLYRAKNEGRDLVLGA